MSASREGDWMSKFRTFACMEDGYTVDAAKHTWWDVGAKIVIVGRPLYLIPVLGEGRLDGRIRRRWRMYKMSLSLLMKIQRFSRS